MTATVLQLTIDRNVAPIEDEMILEEALLAAIDEFGGRALALALVSDVPQQERLAA